MPTREVLEPTDEGRLRRGTRAPVAAVAAPPPRLRSFWRQRRSAAAVLVLPLLALAILTATLTATLSATLTTALIDATTAPVAALSRAVRAPPPPPPGETALPAAISRANLGMFGTWPTETTRATSAGATAACVT